MGPLYAENVVIKERARVEDIYASTIKMEEKAEARNLYGENISIESQCQIHGEIQYTQNLKTEDKVFLAKSPQKVEELPASED
jgi:cytoskeletal protein CcmA (bactofilin family)